MSLKSLTPPPSCTNDVLAFNCPLYSSSYFIQWAHTIFGSIGIDSEISVGDNVNAAGGRVVANLTRKDAGSTGGQFFLSSTLIIYPPLNNVSNTNINNTNITCEAVDDTIFQRGFAAISLYGEQLRMCFVVHDYLAHCFWIYPLQVSLPLLMT